MIAFVFKSTRLVVIGFGVSRSKIKVTETCSIKSFSRAKVNVTKTWSINSMCAQ